MITTIDSAGRLVVPKAVREAMGLVAGAPVDISFVDGRIQIDFAPLSARVESGGGLPRIVAHVETPLRDADVRAVIESTRR